MVENELKAYVMNTFLSPKSIAHTSKSIKQIELHRIELNLELNCIDNEEKCC